MVMGEDADISKEAGDVVIVNNNLTSIVDLHLINRKLSRISHGLSRTM